MPDLYQSSFPIPSATKIISLTETELLAKIYPAAKTKGFYRYYEPKEGEELKEIKRFPGLQISNFGRLVSHGPKGALRVIQGHLTKSGRVSHVKRESGTVSRVKFSRLLLETWKPNPNGFKLEPVALNGDIHDLRLENWSWMSKTEAYQYRRTSGERLPKTKLRSIKTRAGISTKMSQYSDFEVSEMERLIRAGINVQKVAEIFLAAESYICYVKKEMLKRQTQGND